MPHKVEQFPLATPIPALNQAFNGKLAWQAADWKGWVFIVLYMTRCLNYEFGKEIAETVPVGWCVLFSEKQI
ncbi:hypothetical protein ABFA30_09295 [Pseudomonas sp. HLMP]